MKNISVLVGLKNKLELTKLFYSSFREIYPDTELVFVSYGSTDGTSYWLNTLLSHDKNVIVFAELDPKSLSTTYNKAIELATKKNFVNCHNDMVVAPGFLENICKRLDKDEDLIVSYTTVEPPIFQGHDRPGKITKDFGTPETFKKVDFYKYAALESGVIREDTLGWAWFMAMDKQKFLTAIGGYDGKTFNPMFCEDDDLKLRLTLAGLESKMIVAQDSLVYHFVSQTSRFSDDFRSITNTIEENSNKNFIRKWGFRNSIHHKKYDIGFVISNSTLEVLEILEPWCSTLYVDNSVVDIEKYISVEQPHTPFDLASKIKTNSFDRTNDVLVAFDANKIRNPQDMNILINLSDIIFESGEPGQFTVGNFNIQIKRIYELQNTLIKIS